MYPLLSGRSSYLVIDFRFDLDAPDSSDAWHAAPTLRDLSLPHSKRRDFGPFQDRF